MKTIRVTGIALSIVALLLVAMARPASAGCPGPANSGKLKAGTYAFRLGPAKGFDADLANNGDPGAVVAALREDVIRVGVFTSDGCGDITSGHAFATTDTNTGQTVRIEFTLIGTDTYTLNSDGTGTLTMTPAAFATPWLCTDMTAAPPYPAGTACNAAPFNAPPFSFVGTEEVPETYSISVSSTNGRVELAETDNTGGGAKIFLVGEAIKQ